MSNRLHICFVAYEYLEHFENSQELLDDFFSLTDWCETLATSGCKVSAIVRFKYKDHVKQKGVDYYFINDIYGPRLKFWQISESAHQKVLELKPSIVHTHNFNKVLQHRALLKMLNGETPLLLQNHAEWPRYWFRNWLQAQVYKEVTAFLFCAQGQEQVWLDKRIVTNKEKIHFVMEASTHFQLMDRAVARKHTQLKGKPVFLWVGNLNNNKDPLTILAAFQELLISKPEARLYMIYRFDDLLPEVKAFIQQSPTLSSNVELLGIKKREELEWYYNSADYFLLGSGREGSGYSLMEALACGCIPIVTTIPSFRMMTEQGTIGPLWSVGSVDGLIQAIGKAIKMPLKTSRLAARASFERQLSYQAIKNKMITIYESLLEPNRIK